MIIILNADEANCLDMKPGAYDAGLFSHSTRRLANTTPMQTFEVYWPQPKRLEPLNNLGRRSRDLAAEKGFGAEDSKTMSAVRIALMHQELSEMLEAVRKPSRPGGLGHNLVGDQMSEKVPSITLEAEEAADLFIRLAQYCAIRGIDLDNAVELKHEYNKCRPHKHGKDF